MRYTNIVKAEVHQLEADENVSETCYTFGFKYGDHNSESYDSMANIPSITSEPENSISDDQNQLSDELVSAKAEQVTLANKPIPTLEAHYPHHYPNTKSRTPKPEFERIDIIPRILVTIPEEDENSSNDVENDSEDDEETNAKDFDWDEDDFEVDGDEYFICGVFFTVVIVLTSFFLYVEYFNKL